MDSSCRLGNVPCIIFCVFTIASLSLRVSGELDYNQVCTGQCRNGDKLPDYDNCSKYVSCKSNRWQMRRESCHGKTKHFDYEELKCTRKHGKCFRKDGGVGHTDEVVLIRISTYNQCVKLKPSTVVILEGTTVAAMSPYTVVDGARESTNESVYEEGFNGNGTGLPSMDMEQTDDDDGAGTRTALGVVFTLLALVVIALLVAGGIYCWRKKLWIFKPKNSKDLPYQVGGSETYQPIPSNVKGSTTVMSPTDTGEQHYYSVAGTLPQGSTPPKQRYELNGQPIGTKAGSVEEPIYQNAHISLAVPTKKGERGVKAKNGTVTTNGTFPAMENGNSGIPQRIDAVSMDTKKYQPVPESTRAVDSGVYSASGSEYSPIPEKGSISDVFAAAQDDYMPIPEQSTVSQFKPSSPAEIVNAPVTSDKPLVSQKPLISPKPVVSPTKLNVKGKLELAIGAKPVISSSKPQAPVRKKGKNGKKAKLGKSGVPSTVASDSNGNGPRYQALVPATRQPSINHEYAVAAGREGTLTREGAYEKPISVYTEIDDAMGMTGSADHGHYESVEVYCNVP